MTKGSGYKFVNLDVYIKVDVTELVYNLFFRPIAFFESLNFYFMKTDSFWILNINILDGMMSVLKRYATKIFRIHVFSFFTSKTLRAQAALSPFGMLISRRS